MARLAFFGTPDFAASQFEALIRYCNTKGHTIVFSACQPDRPVGRSQKMTPPPVKMTAENHQIPVFQPETLKSGTPDGDRFYQVLKESNLDLAIVVAYGRIIPSRMLALPRRGFINVHASLLPRWRGASPIQRALLAGDHETGISIIDLVPEMDAGDIYAMRSIPIAPQDNAAILTSRLAKLGSETLLSCLEQILDGSLHKKPQATDGVTFAPKLIKSDGLIPWTKSSLEIVNHARAVDPWPQAYSYLNGKMVKLFGANQEDEKFSLHAVPGTIIDVKDVLTVACNRGAVSFTALQFEGRKQTSASDAINGKLIHVGEQFSTQPQTI